MNTTQETTIERSPVLLPLRVDDAANEHVDAEYHTLSAGNDYFDKAGGIGLAGCMSREQADFIARACNNHEALVKQLRASNYMLTMAAEVFADGPHYAKAQFVVDQCAINAAAIETATK